MKKIRYTPEGYAYRVRTPAKEARRIEQQRDCAQGAKPGKAQRAARRRRLEQAEPRPLSRRPNDQHPRWVAMRERVLAAGRCAWCGATRRLTVDHITPLAAGGNSHFKNLQVLCKSCNQMKGDMLIG